MTSRFFEADVPSLVPTDEAVFFNRRAFVQSIAALGLAPWSSACAQETGQPSDEDERAKLTPPIERPDVFPTKRNEAYKLPESVDSALTPREAAATQNNFYEFLSGRAGEVWRHAGDFEVEPWTVEVTGACSKPAKLGLDDLFKFEHEERLYHFRCVERWAMNVPWSGFPLRKLLEKVEPTGDAKFVRFVSAYRPEQMEAARTSPGYPWPYHEGLRMDEAMNELTLVVTGVYGRPLLKQHGAPVRIIVPWKYGYKSPKSIVRIELVREQPPTFWSIPSYRHEYGFLSNVNPNIPHPRWSQSVSHWVDRPRKRFATPIFNGYDRYVAHLYPDAPRTAQAPLKRGQVAR